MYSTHEKICENLRRLRQLKKVSQSDVDKALGWKPCTYGKLERGGRRIAQHRLESLCAYFETNMLQIQGYTQVGVKECPDIQVLRQLETREAYKQFLSAIGIDVAALIAGGYRVSFDKCRKGVKGRIIISW